MLNFFGKKKKKTTGPLVFPLIFGCLCPFIAGNCTWGMNCRFIHPGVNDKGNYSLISKPDPFSHNGGPPGGPHPLMPANPWVGIHLFAR